MAIPEPGKIAQQRIRNKIIEKAKEK